MAQITINIQTLDWTMGETVGLHLMLKKDSKASIAWGDGKVQVVTGKQEPASEKLAWVEAGHSYPEKGMYYTITICSEEEDAIIGFDGCGMYEVKTFDVILTECPNLRILGYSGYGEVDFALTHLRPKDLEYLEKTLKRNSPYKVRGGSFGDDKIIEVCNGKIVGEYEGKLDSTYR